MKDSENQSFPSVSVAIPTLNEEKYIQTVLSVFSESQYPNIVEILVADGGSTDATREIVKDFAIKDPRVKLIDNSDKIQAAGLNKLISLAKGDLFLRADAHCTYASNYVEESVRAYLKSGALNVGGAQRFAAENKTQAYIAFAVDSFLGSGGASYRNIDFEGYAETVFLGCYNTDVLKKLGGFLPGNVTNEDAELNIRLEKEKKGAIYISPDIKVWYYPRRTFKDLFIQYYKYGIGRCNTFFVHSVSPSIRGSIPFVFISLFLIVALLLSVIGNFQLLFSITAGLLIFVMLNVAFTVIRRKKYFDSNIWQGKNSDRPGLSKSFIGCLIAIFIMNIAHFAGFGTQLFKRLFNKR